MQKADCLTCVNEHCLVKKNAHMEAVSSYIEQKHTIFCKKSQQFIIEGAPVHGLYFVYKGKVKVSKTGLHGREQIVRFGRDGEIIGHRGFGTGKFSPISAVALEDTVLCNFTTDVLNEMMHQVPDITYNMMIFYAEELNKSETKVKKFAQMTVREKVIDAFLYIRRKFGQPNDYFDIQLSRKDIAGFAGTTEEQVIRVISSLKKENLLRAQGKKLGIIDLEKLKKEISEHNFFLDS